MTRYLLCALGLSVGVGLLMAANCAQGQFGGAERTALVVAAGTAAPAAAAIEFGLYECGEAEPTRRVEIPLQSARLAELRTFADVPVEASQAKGFADHHFLVEPGCWRVEAGAVDAVGRPAASCARARTPDTLIDAGYTQRYTLLTECAADEGPVIVDGRANHPPRLVDVSVDTMGEPDGCQSLEICATASDPDRDRLEMHWSARDRHGKAAALARPKRPAARRQGGGELTECVRLAGGEGRWDVDVTVRDVVDDASGGSMSREDLYLTGHALVTASHDSRALRAHTECQPHSCPDDPSERIDEVIYWITRDGELLAPTEDLSQARPGDMIDVEFEVARGCQQKVTFASYTSASAEEGRREEVGSAFTRSYGPGRHLLWNMVPDCRFVVDLHLGDRLGAQERPAAGNPYGARLIDSFAGGEGACDAGD
jgi:hypothetical protein